MTIFIGIDPSTKFVAATAYCDQTDRAQVWLEDISEKKFAPVVIERAWTATARIVEEARRLGNGRQDAVAWVESPIVGVGGVQTTLVQSFVSGGIQLALHQAGIEPRLVQNTRWKAVVVGNGRASKEEIATAIEARWRPIWKLASGSQDVVDSAAICLYGVVERSGRPIVATRRKLPRSRT